MSKTLVLAEKPSVGRDLARVLHCTKKENGYLEGDQYVVTWALGHLVTLADPEAYGDQYKEWRLEDLPMLPAELKLTVIKQSGRQFQTVKAQLLRKDVQNIVIATDAGREGELVARWILEKVHVHKPIKRLWISSVTDKAILAGFANLKPGKDYENLYGAAVARAEADWLVGINATRALTCKYNAQLSCGRVQTPTLAIIARREAEIQEFQPRPFFGIQAAAGAVNWTWQESKSNGTHTFNREFAEKLVTTLQGKTAEIVDVHTAKKHQMAPALYDLTELQRDANRIFDFSAKETLAVMQKLYETHKILTYPRTDSRYITTDIVATLKERVNACGIGPFTKFAFQINKKPIRANAHFVDNGKVSDHHAIIPTEQYVNLTALSDRERKIYDLVVRRFLAVLSPAYEYEQTTLQAKIGDQSFVARGKRILSLGWKELYIHGGDAEEDAADGLREQELPLLTKGQTLPVSRISLTSGKTKPPAYFTEATLLSAMENPVKYMSGESASLKKTIGETGGLGTVATRADIIEKLFNSFFLERKGKEIHLTGKGRQLLSLVPEELRSPALTAEWEEKLGSIAHGRLKKENFIGEMRNYAKVVVTEIKDSSAQFKHDNLTRTKCPECGKYLLEVNGKKGKMLVCQDRSCGYHKGISRITNARCPNCHKKLEMRGEGEGKLFVCATCGYHEKLSAFQHRREQDGVKANKHDVQNYLRQQKKVEHQPINTALADALAKLKLK